MKKEKKKKRRVHLFIILLAVLLCLGGLAYWQRKNIEIVFLALLYDEAGRSNTVQKKEELVQEALAQYPEVDVVSISEEGSFLLAEGVITEEEAMQIVTKQTTLEELMRQKGVEIGYDALGKMKVVYTQKTQDGVIPEATEADKATQEPTASEEVQATEKPSAPQEQSARLQELIAKIYVLRSNFVGRLDALIYQGKQEIWKHPDEKASIEGRYLNIASNMERECDAQLEAILVEIEAELIRTGNDLSLIDQIRAVYAQEKSAKKASILADYAS